MKQLWPSFTGPAYRENQLLYYWSDEDKDGLQAWGKQFLGDTRVRHDKGEWFTLYGTIPQITKLLFRGTRESWNCFQIISKDNNTVYTDFPTIAKTLVNGRVDVCMIHTRCQILRVESDDDAVLLRMAGVDGFELLPIA